MSRLVDMVVLLRGDEPMDARVRRGIQEQVGVRLRVHRIVGQSRTRDGNRWETIARARNEAKQVGDAPWLFFLDDDVVLAPSSVSRLLDGLTKQGDAGALAADYLGESRGASGSAHVAMGAVLFRRSALVPVQFRWEPARCECQCCCDDLRRLGWQIGYLPAARAIHLKGDPFFRHSVGGVRAPDTAESGNGAVAGPTEGRVFTAFDRLHFRKFCTQFLPALRSAGNREPVTAVGCGLYPSQIRSLRGLHIDVWPVLDDGRAVPLRRLEDFQRPLENLHPDTPVAHWDAGDVIIQDRLEPLWQVVRSHPDKILAAREPSGHPHNGAVRAWTLSIRDPEARQRAFQLLASRPFLNGGFAAGTARALLQYLREAQRLLHSPALEGASGGDQIVLNFYCHSDPNRWHEVDETWNYCLHSRRRRETRINERGKAVRKDGTLIRAVHGTANTLRWYPIRHRVR